MREEKEIKEVKELFSVSLRLRVLNLLLVKKSFSRDLYHPATTNYTKAN